MIRIAHLYYDLLNLFGENANVRALVKQIEKQGEEARVQFLSLGDKIEFDKYDFFYIGSGTIDNILLALEDLAKYKEEIKKAVLDGKFFLVTGDVLGIFGEEFVVFDKKYEGLGVSDYSARVIDFRIVGEQFYRCNEIKEDVIGFQNRETVIDELRDALFKVESGTGYKPNVKEEGIRVRNFIGTFLLGPLLVRNPYLVEYLVREIFKIKGISYSEVTERDVSYKAYEEFIKNFKVID